MTPPKVPFPKRDVLFRAVSDLLKENEENAVTVRQLYYLLVASKVIPNSQRAYKNVGAALTEWRRKRKIPMRAFEDLTRSMKRFDKGERENKPFEWAAGYIAGGVQQALKFRLARWFGQPNRVVVVVEKQALQGPFSRVCKQLEVDLAVCRGYASLSYLQDIADALSKGDRERAGRKNVLLYFGDLDPSGLNIPETVERDLSHQFRQTFEFHRIALTQDQVRQWNLSPDPIKMGDSRAAGFMAENGTEVYELDSIPPDSLRQLIETSVNEYFDEDLFVKRTELMEGGRKRIKEKLDELGITKFLTELGASLEDPEGDEPEGDDEDDAEEGQPE